MGFEKLVNEVDAKEAARLGLVTRPLTEAVVQKQLEDLGLEAAFGTHSHIRGLSGGSTAGPACVAWCSAWPSACLPGSVSQLISMCILLSCRSPCCSPEGI